MRTLLFTVAFLLVASGCRSAPETRPTAEAPKAFLWEVTHPSQPGRKLYLTGSVHLGTRKPIIPLSVEEAFAQADVIAVEADVNASDPAKIQQLVMSLGLLPADDSVERHLKPETFKLLPSALEQAGLPAQAALRMRPWLLMITLLTIELQKNGFSGSNGIDSMFLERARGKKKIVELESVDSQLRMLAGLPEDIQDLSLRDLLSTRELVASSSAQIISAWEGGNAQVLEKLTFTHQNKPEYAPMYEAIYFQRNEVMAEKIAERMMDERRHFVVVGAGHLVGDRGVPAKLAQRGFQVKQLPRE